MAEMCWGKVLGCGLGWRHLHHPRLRRGRGTIEAHQERSDKNTKENVKQVQSSYHSAKVLHQDWQFHVLDVVIPMAKVHIQQHNVIATGPE